MPIKIKNWKLTLLGLVVVALLFALSYWQWARAHRKKALLQTFKSRTAENPMSATKLNTPNDWRFYRAQLTGKFDNQHTFLLDNKTRNGTVGYEIYTLFNANGMRDALLVDRGFTPMGKDRQTLPQIKPIEGTVTIGGMLNLPPRYVAYGDMIESKKITWPLRVEYINTPALSKVINTFVFPYLLTLNPKSPYALSPTAVNWDIFTVSPERHTAYAFQWFALALTLLVICALLNRE